MSVILTEFNFDNSTPRNGDPYLYGPHVPITGTTGAADIKGGFPVSSIAGRTNEVDRSDSAALLLLTMGQARAPKRSEMTSTVTDPLIDYVYPDNATFRGNLLVPGYIAKWRCVENSNAITLGNTLVCTTALMLGNMTDTIKTITGTTAVLASDADGTVVSIPGENIPLAPKFMALIDRANTATESWIPALFLGR